MSKIKIFNDPIYGLVSYPYEFIYDLIDHPYVQRLRRIQQLGMSSIVYPGATHTRFHHALGALHLCDRLITNLKLKGTSITDEEYEATLLATLLHDVGHGPYSHALEHEIIPVRHEELTIQIMNRLNDQYDGKLDLAIRIFRGQYEKPFLTQMISSQIDVDRMDYLNRDSFYTGVAEGIIGYDRIIKMMNVHDGQLVIEEKGILSVEKFLLSRHFMYQQVYLHKAALVADQMLKAFFKEYKSLKFEQRFMHHSAFEHLIKSSGKLHAEDQLSLFLQLDDSDIIVLIKSFLHSENDVLRILADGIMNRNLFGISTKENPYIAEEIECIIKKGLENTNLSHECYRRLVNSGFEKSSLYDQHEKIKILRKNVPNIVTFDNISRLNLCPTTYEMHFITYPKN